jgi:peptide/nickel transport system permease protein
MRTSEAGIAAAATDSSTWRYPSFGALFWLAAGWIGIVVFAAAFANVLPLPSPTDMDMMERRMPPSAAHWFGTDRLGRDMLSRLIHGARISLTVGVLAPLIGLIVGGALGILAGYFRSYLETAVVAVVDVLLAFPPLVLALAMTAYLGHTIANLTYIIGILSIPAFTRVARAATLSIAQREFVLAARAMGATELRILTRELLPNVFLPLLAFFLLAVAVTIVVEGALSFLGLGVPPPTPSWGSMIGEGRETLEIAPRIAFLPAAFMFLTVLSFNVVGETLRVITDPRQAAL